MAKIPVVPILPTGGGEEVVLGTAVIPAGSGGKRLETVLGFRPKLFIANEGSYTVFGADPYTIGSAYYAHSFQFTDTGFSYLCAGSSNEQRFNYITFR